MTSVEPAKPSTPMSSRLPRRRALPASTTHRTRSGLAAPRRIERGAVSSTSGTSPRSSLLGAARPDLVRSVVITGTAPPLGSRELIGVEGFAGSTEVIDGLVQLIESDYRTAVRAVLSGTNPEMSEDELRDRTEETAAMIEHASAVG